MANEIDLSQRVGITLPQAPGTAGVSLWDAEDPDSLINKVRGPLLEAVRAVQDSRPARGVAALPDKTLRETHKTTATDLRLRISFWEEHARAVEEGGYMRMERVFAGIVSAETFLEEYLQKPMRMGILLNTPALFTRAAQEILLTGLEKLRDIIELPLVDSKGKVQASVISGILKAVDMLDRRIHGSALQRVAVHQHHTGSAAEQAVPVGALAQDQLKYLEEQIAKIRENVGEKYAPVPFAKDSTRVVEKADVVDAEET